MEDELQAAAPSMGAPCSHQRTWAEKDGQRPSTFLFLFLRRSTHQRENPGLLIGTWLVEDELQAAAPSMGAPCSHQRTWAEKDGQRPSTVLFLFLRRSSPQRENPGLLFETWAGGVTSGKNLPLGKLNFKPRILGENNLMSPRDPGVENHLPNFVVAKPADQSGVLGCCPDHAS